MPKKYWTKADECAMKTSTSFAELVPLAMRVLARMRARCAETIGMVCGPITSGGKGSKEKNIRIFMRYIREQRSKGLHIFSQMAFEETFWRLQAESPACRGDALLTQFYRPLFESGLMTVFYFIPGWQSSIGATWERGEAVRLGIAIVDLEPGKPVR